MFAIAMLKEEYMLVEPNSDVLVDHMRNNKKLAMVFLFALGQWAMPFIPPQANSEKHVTKLMAVIPSFVAERAVAETPDSTQAPSAPSFPGLTAGEAVVYSAGGIILGRIIMNLINAFFDRVKNIEQKVSSQSSKLDIIAVAVSLNVLATVGLYLGPQLKG